jgi:endonuclease/exonuclease/phosphatase family metal-dependent hydrolase
LILGVPAAAVASAPTLMTWNIDNYVAETRFVDGIYRQDYPKPEAEKAALRRAVRAAAPDVLALQEMGGGPYLEEFQRDLAGEGVLYTHRAWVDGPDSKRHVAVLSRLPLLRVHEHGRLPVPGSRGERMVLRGVLELTIEVGGRQVTVFVVHLKSRHTIDAADVFAAGQRQSEAEAVRGLILKLFPQPAASALMLVGDCNDAPNSRALKALQRVGERQFLEMLPAVDSAGDSWTYRQQRTDVYKRLDYVMVSAALRSAVGRVEVLDSADIRQASDHRPLLVRFRSAADAQNR